MAEVQWLMSDELARELNRLRVNDVKVEVRGHRFAVIGCEYDPMGDQIVLLIDEDDEMYQDLQWAP